MLWVTGSLGEQEEVSSSKFFEGYHDFVFFPSFIFSRNSYGSVVSFFLNEDTFHKNLANSVKSITSLSL